MKIIHILDSLNRGGIEMMALDVCRNALEHNLDLTFVATGGGELEDEFARSGIEFIRLERSLPVDLKLARQLRRIINERQARVVHCHQAVDALHGFLATRGTDVKRVLTFHGWLPSTKNRVAVNFLIPRMDANLAVSREVLNRLQRELRFDTSRNFSVLLNGVDQRRLRGGKPCLRAELGLKEGALLFGMVGNFYVGAKDQLTICHALPQVFGQSPNLHFAFVGGRSQAAPELFDECVSFCREQGIESRVHFLGRREDIPEVLSSLDAFVFSSLQEGSPIAVIEAMMLRRPVIISDIPALLEVSQDGLYALPFRTRDAADLARQMLSFATDRELRSSFGRKASLWANSQFGIETHIANLKKLYSSLAGMA
ncbi:MAG TPA: glycosyltransferase family 4 protein [Pyrinomonadaceae bacterium]|jgi:glycosyltransferase involved in cell wall biosynthesis